MYFGFVVDHTFVPTVALVEPPCDRVHQLVPLFFREEFAIIVIVVEQLQGARGVARRKSKRGREEEQQRIAALIESDSE